MARLLPNPIRILTKAVLAAVALACLAPGPAYAHEEGAPVWGQFQGGPGHPGALGDGPAPPYTSAWRFLAPEGPLSGPVIAGDVVITVGADAVYGIDLATGEQVWTLHRNGGPLSVPAVAVVGDRQVLAFVDTGEMSGTSLVRVDLGTMRELVPRTPLLATSRSGVTVEGQTAYLGDDKGNLYAIDLDTGSLRWTNKGSGEVIATPAVSGGKVFAVVRDLDAQASKLVALDAGTGSEAWPAYAPPAGTTMSGPSAAGGVVVVGTADRLLYALSAADGKEQWRTLVLSFFSPVAAPAFPPGDLIAGDFPAGVYRVDASTGAIRWDHQLNQRNVRSSPVISGTTVLLGLNDGRLVALDLDSGHLVWQSDPNRGLIGSIALSHETVVAVKGGLPGSLVAFRHDPNGNLVDVPSPTELEFGTTVLRFCTAAAGVALVVILPGLFLRRRFGAAVGTATGETGAPGEDDDEGREP